MLAATDVADLLVRKGMPFREAHGVVGGLVRDGARARASALRARPARSSRAHSELLDDEYYEVLARRARGSSRSVSAGGTGVGAARRAARGRRGAALDELAARARRPLERALGAELLRPLGARGRARPDRLRAARSTASAA